MIRSIFGLRRTGAQLTAALFALACGVAFLGTSSCASVAPPFSPSYQGLRGYKARTFVGTPSDVRPAVIRTLEELGYEVLVDGADTTFVSAVRGMGASDASIGGQREWTRVGVQVRQVDQHRRAPRTLVEVEAERMQGTAEGPIEASFGAGKVTSDFYETFFRGVTAKIDAVRPQTIYGLRPPA